MANPIDNKTTLPGNTQQVALYAVNPVSSGDVNEIQTALMTKIADDNIKLYWSSNYNASTNKGILHLYGINIHNKLVVNCDIDIEYNQTIASNIPIPFTIGIHELTITADTPNNTVSSDGFFRLGQGDGSSLGSTNLSYVGTQTNFVNNILRTPYLTKSVSERKILQWSIALANGGVYPSGWTIAGTIRLNLPSRDNIVTNMIESNYKGSSQYAVDQVVDNLDSALVSTFPLGTIVFDKQSLGIYVIQKSPDLASLSIKTPPLRTEYIAGEVFDPSGMTIVSTYEDGSTSEYTFNPSTTTPLTVNNTTEVISRTVDSVTKSVSLPIQVYTNNVVSIAVTTLPTKLNYLYNEVPDYSGMVVTATYRDNSSKVVTTYTTEQKKLTTLGTINLVISYTEDGVTVSTSFEVVVSPIVITQIPSQSGSLTYNGNTLSPTWSNYDSTKLTIGGTTSATNAGTYTTTFTPKYGYVWSDQTNGSKSINWLIGKASVVLSVTPSPLELTQSPSEVVITSTSRDLSDLVLNVIPTSVTYGITLSNNNLTALVTLANLEPGDIQIDLSIAANTNYLPYSNTLSGTVTPVEYYDGLLYTQSSSTPHMGRVRLELDKSSEITSFSDLKINVKFCSPKIFNRSSGTVLSIVNTSDNITNRVTVMFGSNITVEASKGIYKSEVLLPSENYVAGFRYNVTVDLSTWTVAVDDILTSTISITIPLTIEFDKASYLDIIYFTTDIGHDGGLANNLIIYNSKIYNRGTLLHNLKPSKSLATNKYGFEDEITKEFLEGRYSGGYFTGIINNIPSTLKLADYYFTANPKRQIIRAGSSSAEIPRYLSISFNISDIQLATPDSSSPEDRALLGHVTYSNYIYYGWYLYVEDRMIKIAYGTSNASAGGVSQFISKEVIKYDPEEFYRISLTLDKLDINDQEVIIDEFIDNPNYLKALNSCNYYGVAIPNHYPDKFNSNYKIYSGSLLVRYSEYYDSYPPGEYTRLLPAVDSRNNLQLYDTGALSFIEN